MHLVVDSGNTSTKVAVINEKKAIVDLQRWDNPSPQQYLELIQIYEIQAVIVCSVVGVDPTILDLFHEYIPFVLVLDHDTPVPIRNAYLSPQTLGYDRLAVAVAAHSLRPGKPLLVIDAGTAITYEFVSPDGTYQGGNIAPGAQMRLHALHHFTQKLPLLPFLDYRVERAEQYGLGKDTDSALLNGVAQGMVFEIEGYIRDLKEKYPELLIFLTGGDAFFFERRLKSSIFVVPNLLLFGLHQILVYNTCLSKR
jgi:type III pantothenate kinase